MNLFDSMSGMIEIELTSSDIGGVLSAVNASGIHVYSVGYINDITLKIVIRRRDYPLFSQITTSKGCDQSVKAKLGLYWYLKRLLHRPVLVFGLSVMVLMILYLPSRVFFVQVDGNTDIPDRLILAKAEACGIQFGASRKEIRSERVKNTLLAQIPELQWAGVNTKGCVAVISVCEKTKTMDSDEYHGVTSIVADRDGVITGLTAEQGNALCAVGQGVRSGQVLISGYTDCGLSIRACRAIGEVYALTRRHLTAFTPRNYILQNQILRSERKWAVIIGKKRINFYKDSGILGATYDKISVERKLTLPGGFELPVSVVSERWISYDTVAGSIDDEAQYLLQSYSSRYLVEHMVAGQILQKEQNYSADDEFYCIDGNYACLEMIGREQQEETFITYGKSD